MRAGVVVISGNELSQRRFRRFILFHLLPQGHGHGADPTHPLGHEPQAWHPAALRIPVLEGLNGTETGTHAMLSLRGFFENTMSAACLLTPSTCKCEGVWPGKSRQKPESWLRRQCQASANLPRRFAGRLRAGPSLVGSKLVVLQGGPFGCNVASDSPLLLRTPAGTPAQITEMGGAHNTSSYIGAHRASTWSAEGQFNFRKRISLEPQAN